MLKGYLKLYCKLTVFQQKIHCDWEEVKGIQKLFFLKNYSIFWRLDCDMTLIYFNVSKSNYTILRDSIQICLNTCIFIMFCCCFAFIIVFVLVKLFNFLDSFLNVFLLCFKTHCITYLDFSSACLHIMGHRLMISSYPY